MPTRAFALAILLAICGALTGCGAALGSSTPVPTAAITAQPPVTALPSTPPPAAATATSPIRPTEPPPAAATATSTIRPTEPLPTATPQPSATEQPSTPSAATQTPVSWPPPPPRQARSGPLPTPDLAGMKIVEATSVSSDKQWTARALAAFPPPGDDYYTQLTVRRADGSLSWTVVDRWDPLGLGYTTPQPFLWSRDGHSLYITNRPRPDGCTAFVNAYDLYKLDLSDGKLSQVAPGLGLWLSLSPDEKTLAYAGWRASEQALRFVLRDLATGNERALPGPQARTDHFANDEIGQIQWSPDAAALVYTIAVRPCKGPYPSASVWTESTSIMRVDASSLQQTALIREDERAFITLAWSSPDKVTLKDRAGQTWVMNPVSGQVSKEQ